MIYYKLYNMKKVFLLVFLSVFSFQLFSAEVLDSIITVENEVIDKKVIYDYDASGRLVYASDVKWNINNAAWDTISKTINKYDQYGRRILYIKHFDMLRYIAEKVESEYGYDTEGNLTRSDIQSFIYANKPGWSNAKKTVLTYLKTNPDIVTDSLIYYYNDGVFAPTLWFGTRYNENGFDKTEFLYHRTIDNEWEGVSKTEYKYGEDNTTILKKVVWDWNMELKQWGYKITSDYDSLGRILTEENEGYKKLIYDYVSDPKSAYTVLEQLWNDNSKEWINNTKISEKAKNKRTVYYKKYEWDKSLNIWVGRVYTESEHDDSGNEKLSIRYTYSQDGTWYKSYEKNAEYSYEKSYWSCNRQNEKTFDKSGNVLSESKMYREDSTKPWDQFNTWRTDRVRNDKGDVLSITFYVWSEVDRKWQYSFKNVYNRNENDIIQNMTRYKWVDTEWIQLSVSTYYYSKNEVSLNKVSVVVNVFPNPAASTLMISGTKGGETIRITDLNGRQLGLYKTTSRNTEINVSNFPTGHILVKVGDKVFRVIIS